MIPGKKRDGWFTGFISLPLNELSSQIIHRIAFWSFYQRNFISPMLNHVHTQCLHVKKENTNHHALKDLGDAFKF